MVIAFLLRVMCLYIIKTFRELQYPRRKKCLFAFSWPVAWSHQSNSLTCNKYMWDGMEFLFHGDCSCFVISETVIIILTRRYRLSN